MKLPVYAPFFGAEKKPKSPEGSPRDDGSDQPRPFASLIPTDGSAGVGGDKRPDDAEDGRQDEALRFIGTRVDELGNDPGNQTNDDGPGCHMRGCPVLHAGSCGPILSRRKTLQQFRGIHRSLISTSLRWHRVQHTAPWRILECPSAHPRAAARTRSAGVSATGS